MLLVSLVVLQALLGSSCWCMLSPFVCCVLSRSSAVTVTLSIVQASLGWCVLGFGISLQACFGIFIELWFRTCCWCYHAFFDSGHPEVGLSGSLFPGLGGLTHLGSLPVRGFSSLQLAARGHLKSQVNCHGCGGAGSKNRVKLF